jgi:hypothetical protein
MMEVVMPLSRNSGIFEPSELEALKRVLERLCEERRISPHTVAAESLAADIVRLCNQGVIDEKELLEALEEFLGP